MITSLALVVAICTCTPGTKPDHQYRYSMKHRAAPENVSSIASSIPTVLSWPNPPGSVTSKTREVDALQDERELDTFTVAGYVWLAKIEANDCDIHMEISDSNEADAPRIIVEVPYGTDAWNAAYAFIRERKLKFKQGTIAKWNSPAKIVVMGYAFWDGHHWMASNPKKGNKHGSPLVGTLWEIHPVLRVEGGQ